MNVVSYKTRPTAKDFIQVEIVVEKNTQKIILIGKVSTVFFFFFKFCEYPSSLLWYIILCMVLELAGVEYMDGMK